MLQGKTKLSGSLGLQVIKRPTVYQVLKRGLPDKNLNPFVNDWRKGNLIRLVKGVYKIWMAEKLQIPFVYGALYLSVVKPTQDISDLLKEYADIYHTLNGQNFVEWSKLSFKYMPLGLAGTRVVTDVGVAYIVDSFQNIVEPENQKYHGIGTGVTAEAVGDTALVTELTTEYNPNSTRATGTTTESAANIYRTVATNTLDGTPAAALREHGIFSATSAGVLLDRTLFAAITLSSGDGLQSTYDLTFTAGS